MLARGVRADGLEDVLDGDVGAAPVPRRDRAAVEQDARARRGARAPSPTPGIVLSQPAIATMPSNRCPRAISSIESAITSRLTPGCVFMPLVPIVMPSEIAIVLNSIGVPPAAADALLDLLRERPVREVARHRLGPAVRDGDDRPGHRLGVKADAVKERARRRAFRALGQRTGLVLGIERAHARDPTCARLVCASTAAAGLASAAAAGGASAVPKMRR